MHALALSGLLALPLAGVRSDPSPQAPRGAALELLGNRVDYQIEARVDTATMTLEGRERVRFTNRTAVATDELWLHLYWNAFSSNRSTHLRESGGKLRGVELDSGWGWQRITSLRALDADLAHTLTVEAVDDSNGDDRTVVRCQLPRAVAPGETLEIELAWLAQIPRVRRRTGHKGDFLFMAQWFPKLGVFEGERGWNCHQFHASTEFFSDWGTYEVTLDLPAEYEGKIATTGVLAEPATRADGRVRARFVAPSLTDRERLDATGRVPWVHDFAWTADPDFKPRTRTFHFDEWRSRFDTEVAFVQGALGADKNLRLRDVEVTVLVQPERERQWERHYEATCAALFFYGLWFGEYPLSHLTVVDPAWGASAAGGMEYPALITAGTRLFTTPSMHTPEGVVVHEAGHQFWYGLVGNNEFESGWLDEGFNSFSDSETLARAFGNSLAATWYSSLPLERVAPVPGIAATGVAAALSARRIPLPWVDWELQPLATGGGVEWWRDQPLLGFTRARSDPRASDRTRALTDPARDPIDTVGFRHLDQRSYAQNSYPRTAAALRTLSGLVGRERFVQGMRHYAEKWRYRHPKPQDFFDTFSAGAGVDVQWFFEEVFRGTGTLDWSVSVEQRRAPDARGFAQADALAEWEAWPKVERAKDEQAKWDTTVTLLRRGELRLSVEVELVFDDGTRERHEWTREAQGERRWWKLELSGARKLVSARIDPQRRYQLDLDRSNDAWHHEQDELAPLRWSERAFAHWLSLLFWQAGIGG
ncbi:MAG: M1 family metallopeptidase [Planctomycetes bacterium]|nr:M1 family metallopeptidase [Planctomycetota bacterium]